LVREALFAYALLRVGLSLWAALVLAIVPMDVGLDSPAQPYVGSKPVAGGVSELLLGPWQRFDTNHYLHVAREGYRIDEPIFSVRLPLYPVLIRWLGALFGGGHRYLVAALLISSTATLGYFLVFAALARDALDLEEGSRALLYLSAYPWAFFLLAGYAESLFLFLATLTFWASLRRRWWVAGVCGALAALTRVQGVVLVFPLLLEALRQRRFRIWPLPLRVLWSSLPGLAAVGFVLWRSAAGFPPMSTVYAVQAHSHPAFPWTSLLHAVQSLGSGGGHVNDYLDFGAALLFLALTLMAWRRLSPAYALYMSAAWFLSVSHVQAIHPLISVGRHMLGLFPAFFLLGRVSARNAWLNRLILYPSLLMLLFLSANFVLWGWSG
jgi:hypothetical protein